VTRGPATPRARHREKGSWREGSAPGQRPSRSAPHLEPVLFRQLGPQRLVLAGKITLAECRGRSAVPNFVPHTPPQQRSQGSREAGARTAPVAAATSELPDAARDVTLDGTTRSRTSDPDNAAKAQTTRSSRAVDKKNFFRHGGGDGPRPPRPPPPAPAPPRRRRAAHGHVPDTDATVRDVSPAPPPWLDSRPPHTAETKSALPADTLRCSSDSMDAAEKTGVHSPSTNNAADGRHSGRPLEKRNTDKHAEVGPRES